MLEKQSIKVLKHQFVLLVRCPYGGNKKLLGIDGGEIVSYMSLFCLSMVLSL